MGEQGRARNGAGAREAGLAAGLRDAGVGRGAHGPVALVVSPHASTGHVVAGAPSRPDPRELLTAAGVEVGEVVPVNALDHRLPQGSHWRERGFGAVVAAGGDGTVGAVATQIAGAGLPLGILPLGTSNDVARSLGIPLDLAAASHVIAEGVPAEVDAGQTLPAMTQPGALGAEPNDRPAPDTTPAERAALAAHGAYFMHALTLGLNVSFARLATDVARRQRWGNLTYAASAIEALTQFQAVPMRLTLTGARALGSGTEGDSPSADRVIECRVLQVAVINTPVFGGGMNLRLPRVELHDRLLDFLVIEALDPAHLRATVQGLLDALARMAESMRRAGTGESSGESGGESGGADERGTSPAVVSGDAPVEASEVAASAVAASDEIAGFALPGVRRFQAREAVIETPFDVDVTLDGEIRAHTPILVRVAPEPVRVLLPATA